MYTRQFFHYGPIGLFHLTITEHLIQSGQCLARYGDHHQPADGKMCIRDRLLLSAHTAITLSVSKFSASVTSTTTGRYPPKCSVNKLPFTKTLLFPRDVYKRQEGYVGGSGNTGFVFNSDISCLGTAELSVF